MAGFGIVYNDFLGQIGDVTSGAAIANSIFNTALCFTGLAANQLLQKFSYRKVGLLGICIYCIGSFSTVFVNSLFMLVMTFGILQGIGFGLMMPTIFSAFNSYFNVRRDVIMSCVQGFIGILGILVPSIFQYLMEQYGFRGTVLMWCAISLHALIAMVCLQPVKWHMRKQKLDVEVDQEQEDKPLLKPNEKQELNNLKKEATKTENTTNTLSSINNDKNDSFWKMMVKSLDLGLFKDPVYVNIVCGIALSVTSDLAFLPLFPILLYGNGFSNSEVTIVLTTYFVADLVARLSMTVLYALVKVRNRYVFLISALFSGIFRIVFTMNNSFWWVTSISVILGFLRSPIQALLPLVIAEAYADRFVTAFSLYMVVCGCIALAIGFLAAAVKNYTKDDIMVVHLYSLVFLLCGIPWSLELIYVKLFKRKKSTPQQ